jgi:hypothetical protein
VPRWPENVMKWCCVEVRLAMLGLGVCENPFLFESFDLSVLLSEYLLMYPQRRLQIRCSSSLG